MIVAVRNTDRQLQQLGKSSRLKNMKPEGPPTSIYMVWCSSWCCESGRRQSENGYFTTPGLYPTTVNSLESNIQKRKISDTYIQHCLLSSVPTSGP
ncbi:unnamed protein product [Eretmochelys imbricata]